jgi:hypothetical protein
MLRRLLLVAAALPLSVLAMALVAPAADACHDTLHGCNSLCSTKDTSPILCHDKSTLTFEKEGVVATATVEFASYVKTGALVEAGVAATVTITFSRSGSNNATVDLATSFNATTGIAWDTPTGQVGTLDAGQPTAKQVFGFHVLPDAAPGVKVLEFSILARRASLSDTKWGLLAFETAKPGGSTSIPWVGFGGAAAALAAGAWLFTAWTRAASGGAPRKAVLPFLADAFAAPGPLSPRRQAVGERLHWHP